MSVLSVVVGRMEMSCLSWNSVSSDLVAYMGFLGFWEKGGDALKSPIPSILFPIALLELYFFVEGFVREDDFLFVFRVSGWEVDCYDG